MARVNGQRVTCDRCGETCFVKTTGDGELDGGFTRWNKFEPLPPGWATKVIAGKGMDLCHNCAAEWELTEKEYMEAGKRFANGGLNHGNA